MHLKSKFKHSFGNFNMVLKFTETLSFLHYNAIW